MDELNSAYGDLLLHADVCSKVLQQFVDLLPEMKVLLLKRKEKLLTTMRGYWTWGFLTDLTAKLRSREKGGTCPT